MQIVKLTKSGLRKDIEMGLKRAEIAEKYGLAITQINAAIEQAGLKGMRAKTIKFELVDDEDVAPEEPEKLVANMPDIPVEFPTSFGTPSPTTLPLGRDF